MLKFSLAIPHPTEREAARPTLANAFVTAGSIAAALVAASSVSPVQAATDGSAAGNLTASQIVEKHVEARGGLSAWHGIQTLSASGSVDAGAGDSVQRSQKMARAGMGASVRHATPAADASTSHGPVQLPFRLEMKRPHKSRLEIDFAGQTAVQVFDGQNGWKVRPFLNRNEVEPFTDEEAKATAGSAADIDGPLVDYTSKGTTVQLEGSDSVKGHDAYRLKLTTRTGRVQHVWIDKKTFLDVEIEGMPRLMDGSLHKVLVYQSDFRPVQGVLIPFMLETTVDGYPQVHRMTLQSASLNAKVDDSRFGKPQVLVAGSPARTPPAPGTSGAKN